MKRSRLVRKSPLKARVGLSTHTPLRRTELKPGKPLAPISRKRLVMNRERAVVVAAMRLLSNGICPRCGAGDRVLHGHERLARAHSSTSMLRPDVLICDPCNSAIEDSPQVSCWNGWKIAATGKWPTDPTLGVSQARSLNGTIIDFTLDPVGGVNTQ